MGADITATELWSVVADKNHTPKDFDRLKALNNLIQHYTHTKEGRNARIELSKVGYTPETLEIFLNQAESRNRTRSYNSMHTDNLKGSRSFYHYNSTFGTSRAMSKFVSFLGWAGVVIGSIMILSSLGQMQNNPMAMLRVPGGIGSISGGLILIVLGQIQRATVDAADFAGEHLAIEKFKLARGLNKKE